MVKKVKFQILAMAFAIAVSAQPINQSEIKHWTGSGNYASILVVDFNDAFFPQCYAWGFRYNDTTLTAQEMLKKIDENDDSLTINVNSFLNDIIYKHHKGIGGQPDYWATFTYKNNDWELNNGVSEVLGKGIIFACSYTAWSGMDPVHKPEKPIPAEGKINTGLKNNEKVSFFYPNPSSDKIYFTDFKENSLVTFYDVNGRKVFEKTLNEKCLNIDFLEEGFFIIEIKTDKETHRINFIKN